MDIEDDELSVDERASIERGVNDIEEGRIYKMKDNETLEDFIKRTGYLL